VSPEVTYQQSNLSEAAAAVAAAFPLGTCIRFNDGDTWVLAYSSDGREIVVTDVDMKAPNFNVCEALDSCGAMAVAELTSHMRKN
jgi:hypothetical protein